MDAHVSTSRSADSVGRRRRRPGWRLASRFSALCLASSLALPVVTASAISDNKLGWSSCLWPSGHVVTVATDPAYPLPNPSYSERLNEALSRWSAILSGTRRGGTFTRVPTLPADIVVQYRALDASDPSEVLGETYLQREVDAQPSSNIGICPDRRPMRYSLKAAQIRVAPRNDWFTAPDSATANWQRCSDRTFRMLNGPLCGAQVDFAATMTHELGHTLALYHPETLDEIDNIPVNRADSASTQAKCVEATNNFDAQATMCSGQGMWRSEQRTPKGWDVDTLRQAYGQ